MNVHVIAMPGAHCACSSQMYCWEGPAVDERGNVIGKRLLITNQAFGSLPDRQTNYM